MSTASPDGYLDMFRISWDTSIGDRFNLRTDGGGVSFSLLELKQLPITMAGDETPSLPGN